MPWIYHTLYFVLVTGLLAEWRGRRSGWRGCTGFYLVLLVDLVSGHRRLSCICRCRLDVSAFSTGAAPDGRPPHEAQAFELGESLKGEVECGERSFIV
ncbi:hypothetical protein DFH11DRAFT_1606761 [Phellopilus nigrolimitatus]|nr:hypothetical protein DFH11DRAFT_1606761 [Phellopilus nigrolimitatus]